jgi:antitoxin component YwqK of YwqJK toxin-antitoxin module
MPRPYHSFTDSEGNTWDHYSDEYGGVIRTYDRLNGKLHGVFRKDDVSGYPIEKREYRHGKLHGEQFAWVDFAPDDVYGEPVDPTPVVVCTMYADGVMSGHTETWAYDHDECRKTRLVEDGFYLDGVRHGTFCFYAENGEIVDDVEYRYGQQMDH